MTVSATTHRPDPCVDGQCALCDKDATHKVAEDSSDNVGLFRRHPFTNYVCCGCFSRLMGPMARSWCGGDL